MLYDTALSDARAQLLTDLAGVGVPVSLGKPRRVQPPCVIVGTPATGPNLVAGQLQGQIEMRVDVYVITKMAAEDEDATVRELENVLSHVLYDSLGDWALLGVDSPELISLDGTDFPGVIIHLAKQVQLFDAS